MKNPKFKEVKPNYKKGVLNIALVEGRKTTNYPGGRRMIALFLSAGVGFVVFMIGFGLKHRAKTIASRRAEEGQKSTARASAHA